MVKDALAILRRKAVLEPTVSTSLSGKIYASTQLQSLYEAIYAKPMDKTKFQKENVKPWVYR